MRKHKLLRLYVSYSLKNSEVVVLDKSQSHYVSTVMRRKVSDSILLFNGIDGEFEAEIISLTRNKVDVKILQRTKDQHDTPDLALIFSPVKNVKTEYIVQKATELGVKKIFPAQMERTVAKLNLNFERLESVAIEASEQCERFDIPKIYEIKKLEEILKDLKGYKVMLCDETGQGTVAAEVLPGLKNDKQKWAVIIGPEGGFSSAELEMIYGCKNVIGVGMGPRILRADTAIISALTLWQTFLGDYNIKPDFRGDLN